MSVSRSTFAAAIALFAAMQSAGAQEYCVSCSGPNGLYRCIIEDARPGVAPSLQAFCLSRMAKDGGHAQCEVKRGVTVFECDGVVKRVSMAAETKQPQAAAPLAAPPPTAPGPPAPSLSAATAPEPPKTVAEMAKRAKADSDRQIEKAGRILKKSLGCIVSLFTKCSDGEQ